MEVLIRLMINTFKVLIKKKSYILMGIILPAFIIVFFSFEFGGQYNFKVGIIDKDNTYVSQEIIKTITSLEDVDVTNIKEKDYKVDLITQQIQMVIIINKEFEDNLLNLKDQDIIIKSTSQSDIKATIESLIKSKIEDFIVISKLSNKDINKFKEINQYYNDIPTELSLNDIEVDRPSIEDSMGLVIMMIFILGGNITNFLIEDEENHTKIRILSSGISETKYYISMIIVFYIMSCITSVIYYGLWKILNIDFGMNNSINFLFILLLLNLLAIALNLFVVSFSKSRYTSNIINILIIVPSCMVSGIFWDFEIMPTYLQKIGSVVPIRWAYICIEELQENQSLLDIKSYIYIMIMIPIIFFIITIVKLRFYKKKI
ncbi:MAG: ABC transporter permease [Terrisporobacter sp.]|uniref:ABC transporter permease n=1 Tax=Terrisporobacter sp. TaxID=1965305 RepID=UPI002FE6DFC5